MFEAKVNQLSEEKKAYWAGIIDGEGSIQIIKVMRASERSRKPNHQLRLTMGNTCKDLPYTLLQDFGLGCVKVVKMRPNHRQAYMYSASPKIAYQILLQIYPYLIAKKRQAKLAITFQRCKNHVDQKNRPKVGCLLSSAELEFRDEFLRMIHKLNQGAD